MTLHVACIREKRNAYRAKVKGKAVPEISRENP
jgi:hypothetical protein